MIPLLYTFFFSIASPIDCGDGPQASPCFLVRRVRRRLSPPRVVFSSDAWDFSVFFDVSSDRFVHFAVLPFAVPWIPLPSCHSCFL
jgi:hypothetical protein